MKFTRGLLLGITICLLLNIWLFGWEDWSNTLKYKWENISEDSFSIFNQNRDSTQEAVPLRKIPDQGIENEEQHSDFGEGDEATISVGEEQLQLYIGMSETELLEYFGSPSRKDPSAYGYEWWIYNEDWSTYIQIGVKDNKVVTFYTNAPTWTWNDLRAGVAAHDWQDKVTLKEEISFHYELGLFTFTLSEKDLQERPIVVDGNVALQLYIDIHDNNKISAIRLMDLETLLLHRPYALKYMGRLPEYPIISEGRQEMIAQGNEKQILDIINVTRRLHALSSLEYHEGASVVARGHSLDMLTDEYFDHYSPTYGDLGARLNRGNVRYRGAGENIAFNYIDGPDAHEGWMNSIGHRENVLRSDFSHLGIGVVEKYYTQNFIIP